MMTIRMATPADAPAICAIYAPFITDAATSFEKEVPPAEEMQQRIAETQRTHPVAPFVRGAVARFSVGDETDLPEQTVDADVPD